MRIIIIHGDDTEKSYHRLGELIKTAKKRGWEIDRLSVNSLNLSEKVSSDSLFKKNRLFIMERLFKTKKSEIEWLKKNNERLQGNLVVFHEGTLTKTFLSSLPKTKRIEEFKLPRIIFKFLESFYPGNEKNSITLLHQVLKEEAPEFVLALLARHLRDLVKIKNEEGSLGYPDWRVGKLKFQAGKFNKKSLKKIIGSLSEADVKSKTSKTPLAFSLDLLIVTQLE